MLADTRRRMRVLSRKAAALDVSSLIFFLAPTVSVRRSRRERASKTSSYKRD